MRRSAPPRRAERGEPLTTMRQPLFEMAASATRLLLGDTPDARVELSTSLVVRESTGPA